MTEPNCKYIRISADLHAQLKAGAAAHRVSLGVYVARKLGSDDPDLTAENWRDPLQKALNSLPEQLRKAIAIETRHSSTTLTAVGKEGHSSKQLQIHLRRNNDEMARPCPTGGPKGKTRAAKPRLEVLRVEGGQVASASLPWYLRAPSIRQFAREVRGQLLFSLGEVGLIERVPEPVDDEGRYFFVPESKSWRYVDSGELVLVSDDLSDMVLGVDD